MAMQGQEWQRWGKKSESKKNLHAAEKVYKAFIEKMKKIRERQKNAK